MKGFGFKKVLLLIKLSAKKYDKGFTIHDFAEHENGLTTYASASLRGFVSAGIITKGKLIQVEGRRVETHLYKFTTKGHRAVTEYEKEWASAAKFAEEN